MACYYIPMLLFKSQTCHPIAGFWDSELKATCLDQEAMFAADTVISAISDTAILILPIPACVALQISWRERIKVIAMLGTGGVATLTSIIRMILILGLQHSKDLTVDIIRFNLLGYAHQSPCQVFSLTPAVLLKGVLV
ncbi:hypothetical protein GTA08_BOTSDO10495 [Neofusicoccum parvum]|nr:hypothetical protein GTA08_BOTSDO10495 [Neofusicoccum parvum]